MHYEVRARVKDGKDRELYEAIEDGTMERIGPDGREMRRAFNTAIVKDGVVIWNMTCFCPTPLQHERAAFLDNYFFDIQTEIVEPF